VLTAVLIGVVVLFLGLAALALGFYPFLDASSARTPATASRAASDFGQMLSALREQSSDQSKLAFVKLVSRDNTFTSEQARRLLEEFDFDPSREQAAIELYPQVTDKNNFFLALEAFTFDPGRSNVVSRLGLDKPAK
jgi:hypothetical protein